MQLNPDPDDGSHPSANEVDDMIEDFGAEYEFLNNTLDQLDAQLDVMEKQNKDLFVKFQQLLETNRQTRQELEAERLAAKAEEGEASGSVDSQSKSDSDMKAS